MCVCEGESIRLVSWKTYLLTICEASPYVRGLSVYRKESLTLTEGVNHLPTSLTSSYFR